VIPRFIEGVPYHRFVIRFRLANGKRRVWVRYSPALQYVRSELVRELEDRGIYPEHLRDRSCTIRLA
jgi:hypothetical protein